MPQRVLMCIILGVVLGGVTLGCGRQTTQSEKALPLRSSVIFALESKGGKVQLSMWTTEVFPCLNYTLQTRFKQRGNRVELTIQGITPPETCFGKEGPARYSRTFEVNSSSFDLVIRGRGGDDRYRVTITRSKVELRPLRQTFTDYWR